MEETFCQEQKHRANINPKNATLWEDPEQSKVSCTRYSQQEYINYIETFALVAKLKVIRILLSFVAHHQIIFINWI